MKISYEKHQRDYTVLATSIVMEEVFTKRLKKIFSTKTHPAYILIKNGFLHHLFLEEDYKSWPNSWLKKYNISDLIKYKQKIDKLLIGYKKFLKQKHNNLKSDIEKTNQSIRDFVPIIMISTYVPMYGKIVSKKLFNLCFKIRKQYEDVHKTAMSLQAQLLRKLEKQLKLKKDILVYLTIQEFRNFLLNKKLPKNIEKRKNFVLIEHSFNGEKVFNKTNAIAKLKVIDPDVSMLSDRLKGFVACQGVVRGRVKKIRLVKEANKFKKGDILVTSMTDPRYVSAMKKAGAIVTDEGGVTCHAAIVARELKKPCIIGTKIATKVLKDGDRVEVDANKGVIKILR